MKKKFLIFAVMLLGAFLVGCSSEDDYNSYELDDDAKLEYTKNLILSYGQKYGVTGIFFDDELLKKNINQPKEEFEKEVICMAIEMGKIEPTSKIVRKIRRSSAIGGNENNPGGNTPKSDPVYLVHNTKEISRICGNYKVVFSFEYWIRSTGINRLEVVGKKVDVYNRYYCNNWSCKVIHETLIGNGGTCECTSTSPVVSGSFILQENTIAHLIINYSVDISFHYNDVGLHETITDSFEINQRVVIENNSNN